MSLQAKVNLWKSCMRSKCMNQVFTFYNRRPEGNCFKGKNYMSAENTYNSSLSNAKIFYNLKQLFT